MCIYYCIYMTYIYRNIDDNCFILFEKFLASIQQNVQKGSARGDILSQFSSPECSILYYFYATSVLLYTIEHRAGWGIKAHI